MCVNVCEAPGAECDGESSNLVQKEIKVTFCQYFVQHKAAVATTGAMEQLNK